MHRFPVERDAGYQDIERKNRTCKTCDQKDITVASNEIH